VGDVVRSIASERTGKVIEVNRSGNFRIHYTGDKYETNHFMLASGFAKVEAFFDVGDLVRGIASERTGRVVEVNSIGNFRIHYTGDQEETQHFMLASGFTKAEAAMVPIVVRMPSEVLDDPIEESV